MVLQGHTNQVTCIAFSPDGKVLFSGSRDNTVRVWEAATGNRQQTLEGHGESVLALATSPTSPKKFLATASNDKTLRVWYYDTGKVDATAVAQGGLAFVAYSPDGLSVAAGGWGGAVWIWNTTSGLLLHALPGQSGEMRGLQFSPDGGTLAAILPDGTLRLWAVAEEARRADFPACAAFHFSPDGKLLAVGQGDGSVDLHDAGNLRRLRSIPEVGDKLRELRFAVEGKTLIRFGASGKVFLCDPGPAGGVLELKHPGRVTALSTDPGGRLLVTACDDGSVRVWSAVDGRQVSAVQGSSRTTNLVAVSRGGEHVAAVEGDLIHLWAPGGSDSK